MIALALTDNLDRNTAKMAGVPTVGRNAGQPQEDHQKALGIHRNVLTVLYTVKRTGAQELPFQWSGQAVDCVSHIWIEFQE